MCICRTNSSILSLLRPALSVCLSVCVSVCVFAANEETRLIMFGASDAVGGRVSQLWLWPWCRSLASRLICSAAVNRERRETHGRPCKFGPAAAEHRACSMGAAAAGLCLPLKEAERERERRARPRPSNSPDSVDGTGVEESRERAEGGGRRHNVCPEIEGTRGDGTWLSL